MIEEVEWISLNSKDLFCCGRIDYLVCDIHGNIYIAEYDDDRKKFYPVYGHRDLDFDDIPDVTHFAYLPASPNKKKSKTKGTVMHDDCVPHLLKAMHDL